MQNYGLFRVATASPVVHLADPEANATEICSMIDKAQQQGVELLVFPELSLTGYTCGDLFTQRQMLEKIEQQVERISDHLSEKNICAIIGAPVLCKGLLYNCAIVLQGGLVYGIVPKIYLPNTGEFYEARWFTSGAELSADPLIDYAGNVDVPFLSYQTFTFGAARFGVEICEDLWTPIPPSTYHCLQGATVIANLSASNELGRKENSRKDLIRSQSLRCHCGYIYSCCGYGESTQDTVYAGASMICEDGEILESAERFSMKGSLSICDLDLEKIEASRLRSHNFNAITPDGTRSCQYALHYHDSYIGEPQDLDFSKALYRKVDPAPFIPSGADALEEIVRIQTAALCTRLEHIHCKNLVVGISGGLDSTLALLIAVLSFDRLGLPRSGVLGVTMPGYGTSDRTHDNALALMQLLGVSSREISIAAACDRHFQDIGHDKAVHDTTYENSQARERTQILMDLANKVGGIVLGTGDLSELALGWCTYNGDHMSMYGVNAGIPKTLVRQIVLCLCGNPSLSCAADILTDIVDTPISPELIPTDDKGSMTQITEDLVGPYELHDFFLYNFLRYGYSNEKLYFYACRAFEGKYSPETIDKWLKTFIRRFFNSQFKRSCLPDGPKVTQVSLSPRGDWRMPSDASPAAWNN